MDDEHGGVAAPARTGGLLGWSRAKALARAVVGTGLTFAVGGGTIFTIIGTTLSLLGGPPMRAVLTTAARASVLSGMLGIVFSGLLALVARGRSFEALSVRRFAALGAGVGVGAWLLMGVTGAFSAWSVDTAVVNLGLLSVMGGGSAAALLAIARRGRAASTDADS